MARTDEIAFEEVVGEAAQETEASTGGGEDENSELSGPADAADSSTDLDALDDPIPVGIEAPRRRRSRRAARAATTVLAAALTVSAILSASAFAYDRVQSSKIPPDIYISGLPVGGLTREEARAAVATMVSGIEDRKLYLNAAGQTFWVSLEELDLDARVDQAIDQAYEAGRRAGVVGRLKRWLGRGDLGTDVPLEVYPSREAVERRVVASVAGAVNKEPTEAAIEEKTDDIVFRPASPGVELEGAPSSDLVYQAALALIEGRDPGIVRLPIRELPVKEGAGVTTAILVRVREQRLYFYENATLSGVYKVSTGTPQYPTPLGKFRVVEKIVNPSWTNPAPNGWGSDMPAYIPPGPNNPLGTRALQLSVPGILIHGTQKVSALGSPASHGCIRMNMAEIEALFPRVPVGTPVFVRP